MPIILGVLNGGATLIGPSADGTSGQVLRRSASAGVLEFATIAGGAPEIDINLKSDNYTQLDGDRGDLIDFDAADKTPTQVAALKALGERSQHITADDVSAAWARHRPDGKVVG